MRNVVFLIMLAACSTEPSDPSIVRSLPAGAYAISVGDAQVDWMVGTTAYAMPKAGGDVVTLGTGAGAESSALPAIADGGSSVFFSTTVGIWEVPATGGAATLLPGSDGTWFAVVGAYVYWRTATGVARREIAGGAVEDVTPAAFTGEAWPLGTDGNVFCWVADGGDAECQRPGGAAVSIGRSLPLADAILLDGQITFGGLAPDWSGGIYTAPTSGGSPTLEIAGGFLLRANSTDVFCLISREQLDRAAGGSEAFLDSRSIVDYGVDATDIWSLEGDADHVDLARHAL